MSDSRQDFGLEIEFTDHLQAVTTSYYYNHTKLHTLQINRAHRLLFSVCYSTHYLFAGNGF
jgi:hypothetical protein